ncbi:hypothetical protein EZS27_008160 [termite gut metagenome]|uniref:Uncharacterized protein n=1 Tax=termite gut metagenome TaxID=433724 RepID=A0A5J4SDG6_9ZZZZ
MEEHSATNTNNDISKNPDDICKDPSDGRKIGDWESKYPQEARNAINWEKRYLLILLSVIAIMGFLLGIQCKSQIIQCDFALSPKVHSYCFAWIGGMLGGIVFVCKWLYHTVARGIWHIDRRIWRVVSPILSGIVALIFVVIFCSGIASDVETYSVHKSCGIGFLVGYFSDNAIGKLSELANVFFAKK